MVMLNEMVLPPVQKERETRPLFEEEVITHEWHHPSAGA
jgi:hypothetical protein